ncbi:MAG: DUF2691 family protein [Clostridia bacterium]|nr:DUF2691 family protein [Clostridia bacterium]
MCLSIEFVDLNKNFELLKKLLLFLNAEKYEWIIGDADIYSVPDLESILNRGEYSEKKYSQYSGDNLISLLGKPVYYVFVELFAFDSFEKVPETYEEFLLSNCEIALFVDDCNYYSLFVKDKSIHFEMNSFLVNNGVSEISVLDDENANRLFGL